jgi:thioredoxin reductase (NADPH)
MNSRPIIMLVDDDPKTMSSLLDALVRRFGGDYQVKSHLSANEALKDLKRIKDSGEQVALVIADLWMPESPGLEFLGKVHDLHPNAQRGLLVSWGDRSSAPAILEGCGTGKIENYLLKPWSPPEIHLYPVISEFLSEWTRAYGPRMELVHVVGEDPTRRVHEIRELLDRNGIPHGFHLADSKHGKQLLEQSSAENSELPAVILLDGHVLSNPTNSEILDSLGSSELEESSFDVVVVGAGPAGLSAAAYAASEGLSTLVIEREVVGGQAGASSLIRNYLGFPRGITGTDLAQRAYQQAWLFGAKYVLARSVTGLNSNGLERIVSLSDGRDITARAVVIASGASYIHLNSKSLERFVGAGMYFTTPSDYRVMKDSNLVVVGGGNSAGQAVDLFSKSARKVTLIIRGDSLEKSMSEYLIKLIKDQPNVEIRFHTEVVDGIGEETLKKVILQDCNTGEKETRELDALYVLVGAKPHTKWLADVLRRDKNGFIITGRELEKIENGWKLSREPMTLETCMPGVFAIGDVRAGSVKRISAAVGEGSVVVQQIHGYFNSPVDIKETVWV